MTREECKDFLVKYIEKTGGIRRDQLVSAYDIYATPGVAEVFHPDMVNQLVIERKIGEISYLIPNNLSPISYLVPIGSTITLTNLGK